MTENEELQLKSEKQITTDISDKDITHILEKCGTFGPYQRWFYAYITIICMLCTTPGMNFTFNSASVPFLCYPPNFNASLIPANLTENEYLEMLQPDDDQCSVYNNSFIGTYYAAPPINSSKLQCSYGRKFLTEKFSSVVSEFDLVCERKWLKSTLQSTYFAGYLIGSILFGVLSDRFGRRSIFLLTNTVLVICGITKIFVPSLTFYIIVYCIQGAGYIGTIITTYALTLEFTSLKLRTPVNCWYFSGVQLGGLFLPVYAYAIPDWHYLELALCLLPVINFFISIFVPESPRWFIGKKRFSEAKALLEKVMKKNNLQNEEALDILTNMEEKTTYKKSFQRNTQEIVLPKKKNHTFIDLFKTSWLALITLNVCFTWMVCSMLYYGVTLNSLDMAGNRYINVFIIMAIEFPSFYCTYYLFTRFDHRKPITFFLVFSGLNCIASNFVTEGSFWFPVILVVLGKFGISGAFTSIFLLSAEIFPTVVRTNGLGIASLSSRIGGISAPFILQLSYYVKWLPLSIFGLLSVIAGFLLLLLPDTKDRNLPETFEDLDNWKT